MMAATKPSVEEKREMARKAILDVSMELFYTKGFEETTTRDIVQKAGILNGSLYNRFKNKDEILICMVKEAITETLEMTKSILDEEKNALLALSFPGTLQIFLAYRSRRIAQILYRVHGMWDAVEEYVDMNTSWAERYLKDYGLSDIDADYNKIMMVSIIGSVGNIVGMYANGAELDIEKAVRFHVSSMAANLGLPTIGTDSAVNRLREIISSTEIVFMGHNLSKEVPELSNPQE